MPKQVLQSFTAVFGVEPGYDTEYRTHQEAAMQRVAAAWDEAMEKEFASSKILVTAVCTPGRVVYQREHGCPVDGETIVTVTGVTNPKFVKDVDAWETAVYEIVKNVKHTLRQSRVSLYFSPLTHFVYFEPDEIKVW